MELDQHSTRAEILVHVKAELDKLMRDPGTKAEVRSNELYDHVRRNPALLRCFPNGTTFNQFLRQAHLDGGLQRCMPNHRVDDTVHQRYEWFFFKEVPEHSYEHHAEVYPSQAPFMRNGKVVKTASEEMVRSEQERIIFDALYSKPELKIRYEHYVEGLNGEKKLCDFWIWNTRTERKYYWEHFGMMDRPKYADEAIAKIKWYETSGHLPIKDGGPFMYTMYFRATERQFNLDLARNLDWILRAHL